MYYLCMGFKFTRLVRRILARRRSARVAGIDPDEILIDAENLPHFDTDRFEGRLEKPLSLQVFVVLFATIALILALFSWRLYTLQVEAGEQYRYISENHRLLHGLVFAERGVVTDRAGTLLIWNEPTETEVFPRRVYTEKPGFGHILGYVSNPKRDQNGFFFQTTYIGKDGVEKSFDKQLAGDNGLKLVEIDAVGSVVSESELRPAVNGEKLMLAVDARVQEELFSLIRQRAEDAPFTGGAGVILDIATGEILALTSYPEYDPQVFSDGADDDRISHYFADIHTPLLNRVTAGLYTPGSIVKPYIAIGALEEGIINPLQQILSTGSISIPNPYDETKETIFRDWKAHGWVNMRQALAVSSNVYFFAVGGGYQDQKGLGIEKINDYAKLFGLGQTTGIDLTPEVEEEGLIPNPEWKKVTFEGEPWRLGDTYNSSIGQYGWQVTLLQMARAVAGIASGSLPTPTVRMVEEGQKPSSKKIPVAENNLQIIREGMRQVVLTGTGTGLNVPYVAIAAKSGTAELGTTKAKVNSWITGYFPYEKPRYAFAVMMEQGSRDNIVGATYVTRGLLDWMQENTPEYFQ